MKKVLINCMSRQNGGPAFSLEIAKGFVNLGYDVYAIISQHSLNRAEWEKNKKIHIYEVDTYQSRKNIISKSLSFVLFERKKIKSFFKNINIEYVFNTNFHPWERMVSTIFKKATVVSVCHDPIPHKGTGRIEVFLSKRHIQKSDEVIILTKSFIPILKEKYGIERNKIHYCYHGFYGIYKEIQKNKSELDLFYPEDKINFMFFGRIEDYKGIDVLIKAFEKLSDEINNVTLQIIGNGNFDKYKETCNKLPNVKIINKYISDEEVGNCFTGKHLITVLPYKEATQSGVIPIALEYKVPIIASNTGGLYEQLFEGKIGIFFEPEDVEGLVECMKYYINEENYLKQINKMQEYLPELKWERILSKLMKELETE